METNKRMKICSKIFSQIVEDTKGNGADIIIILKDTLISAITSIAKTNGVDAESVNRTFEVLAHEFLTEAMKTFAVKQEISIMNN